MVHTDMDIEIMRADARNASLDEKRSLYLKRNSFGVDLNMEIYRIFQYQYLLDDIVNSRLTLVRIHPLVFNDKLENPLLDQQYTLESGEAVTLNGIVENFYGLSWTAEAKDDDWRWESFSHGTAKRVRVKVSLRRMFEQIFNAADPYYMLHYFIGRIIYVDAQEIRQALGRVGYSQFLDPRGLVPALTLTTIRSDYEDEREIRLLYCHKPRGNDFVEKCISCVGDVCKVKVDWSQVIQEVWLDRTLTQSEVQNAVDELQQHGIGCRITQH